MTFEKISQDFSTDGHSVSHRQRFRQGTAHFTIKFRAVSFLLFLIPPLYSLLVKSDLVELSLVYSFWFQIHVKHL